jgi:acyl-coenzyme A thioesterase PaaI-like protein
MAALTCMDPGHDVLTAEFKLNYLAPAREGVLLARGRVVKSGRLLTVCAGEAWVGDRQVALMQATMTAVRRR